MLMSPRVKLTLLIAAFLTLGCSAPAQVTSPDFSVVVLPDTQFYSESHPDIFDDQTQWIVANSANYNIQFVLGEGDIVNVANQPVQWQNADAAVSLLDRAGIPYVLPLGNHDYDNFDPQARGTTAFNTYFGPSRYAQYSWYKGGYPSGTNDNFYAEFTVNGQQYLILALEFVPRDGALDWARTVLDANPDKEIIVVTHSFTFTDATRGDQCNNNDIFTPGNNQGEAIWQKLLINYPNLSLVLNGHFIGNGSRRADLGLHGNVVNQIFANYQNLTNGGDGWMRILTFRPALNRIDIVTYSPYLDQYKTDSNNQFSITWHSTGVANGTGTITGIARGQRLSGSPYTCVPIAGATLSAGGESTTSATTGSFSLDLPADNYTLSGTATGWTEIGDDEEAAFPGYTSNAKMFFQAVVGNLAGKVTDRSGNPISGATIALSGGTIPTQISVTTNTTGSYTPPAISVGSYTVTASAAGMMTSTATATINQGTTTTLNIQLNSSSGGTCAASTVNRTVTICSPANNATVTSPVNIVAQDTDSSAVTMTEIYIDGVKKYQIAGSSVNTSLTLAAGTHRIAVLAVDSTGKFESAVNVTVSSTGGTGGTGGTCSPPASAGVIICQPTSGATVSSPLTVQAASTVTGTFARMEVWIDGVKKYSQTGSTALNTSLTLPTGTHRFAVLAFNTAGTKWEQAYNATVQ
jgi:hypothetical protein